MRGARPTRRVARPISPTACELSAPRRPKPKPEPEPNPKPKPNPNPKPKPKPKPKPNPKVLLMPCDTDKYFTLEEARREAEALGERCTLKPIVSPAGHRAGDPCNHGLEAEHDFLRAAVHEHLLQK